MPENINAIFPKAYQEYVRKVGNKDDRIDSEAEAKAAAALCIKENPIAFPTFLDYLEKSGYASLRVQEFVRKTATDKTIQNFKSNDFAIKDKGALQLGVLFEMPERYSKEQKIELIDISIKALEHDDPEIRATGAFVLYGTARAKDVPQEQKNKMIIPFGLALKDESAYVRTRAMLTLWDLNNDMIRTIWKLENVPSEQRPLMVEPLLVALRSKDPAMRAWAAKLLGDLAIDPDIPKSLRFKIHDPLVKAMGDAVPAVREQAARSLTLIVAQDPEDFPVTIKAKMRYPLQAARYDNDPNVAEWGIRGLQVIIELKNTPKQTKEFLRSYIEPGVQFTSPERKAAHCRRLLELYWKK